MCTEHRTVGFIARKIQIVIGMLFSKLNTLAKENNPKDRDNLIREALLLFLSLKESEVRPDLIANELATLIQSTTKD